MRADIGELRDTAIKGDSATSAVAIMDCYTCILATASHFLVEYRVQIDGLLSRLALELDLAAAL